MRVVLASDVAADLARLRTAVLALGHEPADGPDADCALIAVGLDLGSAFATLHRLAPRMPVLVVGEAGDVPALVRAGASGYLRWSALPADLAETVAQIQAGPPAAAVGRVIAVTGPLAGVGVTTVATNLAFAAAGRVVLAQFDVPADLAMNLGLEPARPYAELAAGWVRLDAVRLRAFLCQHATGVGVLADAPSSAGQVNWPTAALRHVTSLLRSQYDTVVIDLGARMDPSRAAVLRLADAVAVVVRPDLPATRAGRDHVRRLTDLGIDPAKQVAVVNRFGQPASLPWGAVRGELAVPTAAMIPDDPARAIAALNCGQPMVSLAADAEVGRAFAELAAAA